MNFSGKCLRCEVMPKRPDGAQPATEPDGRFAPAGYCCIVKEWRQ